MRFSIIELKHLALAWIGISIAFGIVIAESTTFRGLLISIVLAAVTVGIGFLLHELSHKYVAQRYNCLAEFRANFPMILLAIGMSFLGVVFAAPGAVMIFGRITKRQHGIVALSGPLMNVLLALAFIPLYILVPSGIFHTAGLYGLRINAFLALFNMIPLWMFDGHTIYKWSKVAFVSAILCAGIVTFISYQI
jgi:Zn-dependent protease